MRKTMLTTMTVSLLMLGSAVRADGLLTNAAPTSSESLPKRGSATYTGTYALTSPSSAVSAPIQIYVDFASGSVSATLTTPPINPLPAQVPETTFAPTGVIARAAKDPGYTLTQGVAFTPDQPFISISGSFSGPRGRDTAGTFTGTICVPEPTCAPGLGVYVFANIAGTFSATAPK